MRVLKVELEGVTTSFRHPHLLIGRQPSFPLPPPATIHGHIASTLGDYPAPDSFRFAYSFTHQASVDDYEHTWLIERDTRQAKKGQPEPNIQAGLSPTVREMLFQPRLTLYLDRPDWLEAFRNPVFPVLLGRSQDLAAYTRVEVVELEESQAGYFDHTLLPFEPWRPRVGLGQGLLLPRFIDPADRQRVTWARYVALTNRVFLPLPGESGRQPQLVRGLPPEFRVWVDPTSEERQGRKRALEWLSVNVEDGTAEAIHVPA